MTDCIMYKYIILLLLLYAYMYMYIPQVTTHLFSCQMHDYEYFVAVYVFLIFVNSSKILVITCVTNWGCMRVWGPISHNDEQKHNP